ncbi:MAG: restriction endonuclease subunit S [Candidatus Riflebacteria bacterium]|nr:restriction endonuclease subunit S [Candidatus Riflebacteria bacterium]
MKVKLGNICNIQSGGTPSRQKKEYWENGNIPWIKISDFSGKYLNSSEENITEKGLENSSAKMFHKGTILYSIYATLGEVTILDIDASTNQAIVGLTIIDDNISKDYLYYSLMSLKGYVNFIGRGATQNNINMNILRNIEIPIVSLDQQHRIVAILDQVNDLISLRNQQLEQLDLLIKSRFVEMFGDPVRNEKSLPTKLLCELGSLGRGISKCRPRNLPELFGGKYPFIQTGEIANSNIYIKEFENTYSDKGLAQSKMWPTNTLCITIAANIAKTAILTFDACFPDSVVGFISGGDVNQIYIHYWFTFFQKILEEQAPLSCQKNINLKILSELNVMLPPLALQNQFASFVEEVEKEKATVKQSLEWLNTLKAKLMQDYFG